MLSHFMVAQAPKIKTILIPSAKFLLTQEVSCHAHQTNIIPTHGFNRGIIKTTSTAKPFQRFTKSK
jgi:hypothetical protein